MIFALSILMKTLVPIRTLTATLFYSWLTIFGIAPIFFLALSFASAAHCDEISDALYKSVRDVSLQILEKYPPDRYYYLGPGRSNTGVIAFLQESISSSVKTFP